jgi:hypothetical protein
MKKVWTTYRECVKIMTLDAEQASVGEIVERRGWTCNACLQSCKVYERTVRAQIRKIYLGHFECVDWFEAGIPSGPHADHEIDFNLERCSCGAPIQALFTDIKSEYWFSRLLRSKKLTFAACSSRDKAKELGCPNWETCKLCTPGAKVWGKAQIEEQDETKFMSKCPPLVDKPKEKAGGYAKYDGTKEYKVKRQEEFEKQVQDMMSNVFDKFFDKIED